VGAKQHVKFLGIHLDKQLSFKFHADAIISKLRKGLFALNQSKHVLNLACRKLIYYGLFHTHIEYGAILWGNMLSAKTFKTIKILQKRAIRIIAGSSFNAHTDPLLHLHGI
jgi:hypothetical protein